MRRASAALVVALAMLVLAGCGGQDPTVSGLSRPGNHGYHGTYIDPPYDVPAVSLTDNSGRALTLSRDSRTVDVVFFGYTSCPDICQVVMSTITSAYLRLPEADRGRVRVVFVTTDPARDTGPALTDYLARFDPHFVGATGGLGDIDRLARPLGVFIKKGQRLPSGGYEVDHSTAVYAVADAHAPLVWTGGTSAKDMAEDLGRLMKETRA